MTKHIEHSFSQDKMHILMPNTQQMMRDKLADSLKEFHQWSALIRSGEAEVTSMSIKRKHTGVDRNAVLEEVAKEIEKMTAFGPDTIASFAIFIREMKR